MKDVPSPRNVPSEIRLLPRSGQVNPPARKRSRKQSHSKTQNGKTILPHHMYRDALEKVIQRDFFPDGQEEDPTVVSSQSIAPAQSLGSFHAVTTSDRHVRLHNRCTQRSNQLRIHAERKYHRKGEEAPSRNSLLNPVFFGPPQSAASASAPSTLLLEGTGADPTTTRSPVLHATRLAPSRSLPPVPNHWEGDAASLATGGDVSDAPTNLDSTVVASVQSEIRQAATRRTTSQNLLHADAPDTLPFRYELPRSSFREAQAAIALEQRRARPRVPIKTKPTRMAPKSLGNVLQKVYSKKKRKKLKRSSSQLEAGQHQL